GGLPQFAMRLVLERDVVITIRGLLFVVHFEADRQLSLSHSKCLVVADLMIKENTIVARETQPAGIRIEFFCEFASHFEVMLCRIRKSLRLLFVSDVNERKNTYAI